MFPALWSVRRFLSVQVYCHCRFLRQNFCLKQMNVIKIVLLYNVFLEIQPSSLLPN